ncbi:pleiotropic drug resistance 1 [Actinidia rufa]|uniref:Pleiotropic drug resistance 1 n=1 Tax=Actinidia rufa TaxID=165716 RepID=A0A7J0FEP5_9ERIC|nr:pleiotropic drug resistance 1 [Actinidia rufa]
MQEFFRRIFPGRTLQWKELTLIIDYTLRILGLELRQDTIVGDEMQWGISEGQKKRVTTGRKCTRGTRGTGEVYVGALLLTMIINTFSGFAELSLTIQRLPVFYKQRDLLFHPPWAFTLPTFLLRIPISVLESIIWMVLTYYTIGFAPEASRQLCSFHFRFFKQLLVVFLIQQTATGIFRLIAGVCRTMIIANTGGALTLLLVFLLGGFILPKDQIPKWWQWGYWVSPMTYCFNALAVNEMFAPRWMNKLASDNVTPLGVVVLKNFQVFPDRNWFWIGTAALFGFAVLLNILFTLALMYLNPLGKPQAIISKEAAREIEADLQETKEAPRLRTNRSKIDSLSQSLSATDKNNTREMTIRKMSSRSKKGLARNEDSSLEVPHGVVPKRGMVLPFSPLAMSFDSVNYFVDMPAAIPGVPKIKEKYLEVITVASEVRLGIDFAECYKSSNLYQRNKALVKELSTPPPGAKDLYFTTQYCQSTWGQFKSCLWKQWWTYWRTPDYNLVRFFFTLAAALMVGTIFWQIGTKRYFGVFGKTSQ